MVLRKVIDENEINLFIGAGIAFYHNRSSKYRNCSCSPFVMDCQYVPNHLDSLLLASGIGSGITDCGCDVKKERAPDSSA